MFPAGFFSTSRHKSEGGDWSSDCGSVFGAQGTSVENRGGWGWSDDTLGFNPFVAIFLAMMECESLKAYQRNEDALLIDIDCFHDIVIE